MQLQLGVAQRLELLAERAVGGGPRLLDFADLAVHLFKRFAQGLDQGLDRLLALLQLPARLLLQLGERLLCLFEKIGAVGPQRVRRERLELVGQPFMGAVLGGQLGRQLGVGAARRSPSARAPASSASAFWLRSWPRAGARPGGLPAAAPEQHQDRAANQGK